MDIEQLTRQVRYNCDISDARHAGIYSVCGLAMRLRDLYKWEHRLPPWQEGNSARVLEWIGRKEEHWESLLEAQFAPLCVNGVSFDPFATEALNALLTPHGLYLGAGYAHSLKPTFFLAQIDQKEEVAGHVVWHLGREFARDLLTLPAFSQDHQAVLRKEAGQMYLWDQMAYITKSGRWPLEYALRACGLPDADQAALRRNLDTIWRVQKRLYVQHEVGELEEGIFNRDRWRQMLADYPHTPVELLIRSLKDLLADTGPRGPLNDLVLNKDRAGLGFFIAFSAGLIRTLASPLICAFDAFTRDANWDLIADATQNLREIVRQHTRRVLEIDEAGRQGRGLQWSRRAIEDRMRRWGVLPE